MQNKLEEIKQKGNYQITLWYGEELGCDDSYIEQGERDIKIIAYPVGCLGEVRIFWRGPLNSLLNFDFNNEIPQKISNPPDRDIINQPGYYAWGTDGMIDGYFEKLKNNM